ncbi:hypothetical protein ABGB17_18475 [Sphaerisporangium sp. B11E5]|uniref:hypothetical protein n=1 Tax=Sphaerisporangium sp. B11E5 TaxID=3153563 RepID=UPI00325DFE4F
MRSENKSDNTVRIYTDAAERFANWLTDWQGDDDSGPVEAWQDVTRHHIQAWIIGLLESRSAGYANNQFRAIQQFWKWWAADEDLPNPVLGLKPPTVPEQPVDVLRKEQAGGATEELSGPGLPQPA